MHLTPILQALRRTGLFFCATQRQHLAPKQRVFRSTHLQKLEDKSCQSMVEIAKNRDNPTEVAASIDDDKRVQ